jgi:hypothetical protein
MLRFLLLLSLIILLTVSGCNGKPAEKTYLSLKTSVDLPPVPTQGYEFYVFNDCKGSIQDVVSKVFGNNSGEFRILDAEYGKNDARGFLEKQKFQSMEAKFRGWSGSIYYKGGQITDPVTYSGSAKIVIHYVNNIGWFRIR